MVILGNTYMSEYKGHDFSRVTVVWGNICPGRLIDGGTFVKDSMESPKDLSLLEVDNFLWRFR